MKSEYRRWYEHDPLLLEVVELLKNYQDELRSQAEVFLKKIEEKVSKYAIERFYEMVKPVNGNRWYDLNTTVRTAINMLENCPFSTQKAIAKEMAKLVVDKIKEDTDEEE